jgi:Mor family transcriptional regulator
MRRLTARALIDEAGDAIAVQVLLTLMQRYAGHRIPRVTPTTERNVAICAALDAGESYRAVARRYRLDVKTVFAIYQRR